MEKEIKTSLVEYTHEFKQESDRRYSSYKNGTSTPVTARESKKRIRKLLKAACK